MADKNTKSIEDRFMEFHIPLKMQNPYQLKWFLTDKADPASSYHETGYSEKIFSDDIDRFLSVSDYSTMFARQVELIADTCFIDSSLVFKKINGETIESFGLGSTIVTKSFVSRIDYKQFFDAGFVESIEQVAEFPRKTNLIRKSPAIEDFEQLIQVPGMPSPYGAADCFGTIFADEKRFAIITSSGKSASNYMSEPGVKEKVMQLISTDKGQGPFYFCLESKHPEHISMYKDQLSTNDYKLLFSEFNDLANTAGKIAASMTKSLNSVQGIDSSSIKKVACSMYVDSSVTTQKRSGEIAFVSNKLHTYLELAKKVLNRHGPNAQQLYEHMKNGWMY
jgi:hypothetical protein